MIIRNKNFPYPVLAKGNDSYASTMFKSDVEFQRAGYQINFTLKADTDNQELNDLIKAGKAVFIHHIECAQTCYRHAVVTDDNETTFLIHESRLNGFVQITTVIAANEDIVNYKNSAFASIYNGLKFNIKRGCLLAMGDCVELEINKQRDDLTKAASIFSLFPNLDPKETAIYVEASSISAKIKISIPVKEFNIYRNMSANLDIQPMMHAMIIIPALVQVFDELKTADLFDYSSCRWFNALKKACRDTLKIELNEQGIRNLNSYWAAQMLMDSPTLKALAYLAGGFDDED